MSANRTIALLGVLLVVALVAATTGPAQAHSEAPAATSAAPAAAAATAPAAAGTPEAPPVSDSSGLTPWIAAGVLLLAGLLLRRFSRRTLILCLVLLLTLLAFEDALHSVHHGFDPKQADVCTIAMASTHLSAVTVDTVVEPSIILAAVGHTPEPGRAPRPAHRPGPDQGRAPPAQTA